MYGAKEVPYKIRFFFSNKRNEKEIKGEFSEKKETERHPY